MLIAVRMLARGSYYGLAVGRIYVRNKEIFTFPKIISAEKNIDYFGIVSCRHVGNMA